jgi:hypothetical protein
MRPLSPVPAQQESRARLDKLADNLEQTEVLASQKEWGSLRLHVQKNFGHVALQQDLRQVLDEVEVKGGRLQTLTELDELLATGKSPHLSEAELSTLPLPVRKELKDLDSLESLKRNLVQKWLHKPNPVEIEQELAIFSLTSRDANETARLRATLASKARNEGYSEVAEQLSPAGRVRDMETVPPRVDPTTPGAGQPSSPDHFAGVVPEAQGGAAAAPRQSAREGLPPLEEEVKTEEKVETAVRQARQRSTRQVRDQIEVASHQLALHLHRVHEYAQGVKRQSQGQENLKKGEKPENAVARALKRPLTPQDRILLRGMLNKSMTTPQIVAQFCELEAAESK